MDKIGKKGIALFITILIIVSNYLSNL